MNEEPESEVLNFVIFMQIVGIIASCIGLGLINFLR